MSLTNAFSVALKKHSSGPHSLSLSLCVFSPSASQSQRSVLLPMMRVVGCLLVSVFTLFWSFFVTHFHVKIRNNFRAHFSKRIYHGTSLLARRSIPRGVSPCCHAKIRERRISLSFESREKEENARSQRRQRRLLRAPVLSFSLFGNAALTTRTGKTTRKNDDVSLRSRLPSRRWNANGTRGFG